MSTVTKPNWFSYAEYLERERVASTKSEYHAGEIFSMAGGSRKHNTISGNVFAALHAKLSGAPCRPFMSDQRMRISKLDMGTYPDVSVVCGELEGDKVDPDAITNPSVLVEVLSPSTESYDRGKKFSFYRQIDSLNEYVLVSQEEPVVERFKRQPNGDWLLSVYQGLDATLSLESIQTNLPLKDIYRLIDWADEESSEGKTG
ncbi:MAG: Uma2 family endonuclease [Pirellula sp.]